MKVIEINDQTFKFGTPEYVSRDGNRQVFELSDDDFLAINTESGVGKFSKSFEAAVAAARKL